MVEKITKYNSQFEVEWEKSNELIDESIGNYYCSYNQVIQLNDGGILHLLVKVIRMMMKKKNDSFK